MPMLDMQTLLVAVADPGEHAQPVIDRAARIAAPFQAEIVLFHAAFDSALSGRPFFDSKRLARSRGWYVDRRTRELGRHVRALRRRGLAASAQVVWEEPAFESIIRAAIRQKADLVIAGPHVRGRLNAPFPLLQNDWQLLRLCPRPLLLVRAAARRTAGPVLAALDPLHAHDKPATLDRALAGFGAQMARALGAEFHAVHSISPVVYPFGHDAASRRELRNKLQTRMRRSLRQAKVDADRIHVLQGRPEDTIPALARKIGAQALVMGAISRRGLERFALGDTAERMIHGSPCDLLIVKPDNFDLRLGRTRRESVIAPA